MMIPSTHASLLFDLQKDDQRKEAWPAFQTRYRDVILGWCERGGLRPDIAEDLTQDILFKLFQALPQYKHDPARGHFRAWLKTVVLNALNDFRRRQRRHLEPAGVGGDAFQQWLANLESPKTLNALSAEIEGQAQTVAAGVFDRVRARVKETTWQAFWQTMVERRPAAEVAAELGLSVLTIYKANYRIKQMLLEEYGHAYPDNCDSPALPGRADSSEAPA